MSGLEGSQQNNDNNDNDSNNPRATTAFKLGEAETGEKDVS